MILYCIRHGESAYNAEGRIQGQIDIPLSELGRRQGAALATVLAGLPIQAVYCSPLLRARETAAPLAEALRLKIACDDRLKEVHAGVFQGLRWPEVMAKYPGEAQRWKAYEPDFIIPGGESRQQLLERGTAFFHALRAEGHRQVVIVSHGGLLSAALKGLLQIPAALQPFRFYNAAISKFDWNGQLKILAINQTDHLRAAGLDQETRTGDL